MTAKCSAIARSGNRCTSPVLPDSRFCLMHDPQASEVRRAASRKGGKSRATSERMKKALPETMTASDVAAWLSALFTSVLTGRIDAKTGNACAAIARVLLEAQVAASQPSVEDLQEQLGVLRAMVERQGRVA
jgi:hypothetical protein